MGEIDCKLNEANDGNRGSDNNDSTITDPEITNEGIIYTELLIMTDADAQQKNLSYYAEESWNGGGFGSPWWVLIGDGFSSSEDFYIAHHVESLYPIRISLGWQNDKFGVLLGILHLQNESPTIIAISSVMINSAAQSVFIPGPEQVAYQGDTLYLNVNTRINNWFTTTVKVNLISVAGFPNHPYSILTIPQGTLPVSGWCPAP